MFEGFGNIDPNMLSYFMGAAGKAISPEGTFGDVVGSAAMGMAGKKMDEASAQKRTNNFAKLLQGALAGGGKFSMDSEGFNLKAPHSAMKDQGGSPLDLGKMISMSMLGAFDGSNTPAASTTLQQPTMPNAGVSNLGSSLPFSSDSQADFLSSANLEGLTPEDISMALQLRERISNKGFEQLKDLTNLKYMNAQIENMQQDNVRQWYATLNKDDRTELQKNFSAFNDDLVTNGKKPISMERYVLVTGNDSYKDYQLSKVDPAYRTFLERKAKASGTTINIGDRTFEQARAKQKADLYAPDHLSNIEKNIRAEMKAEDDQVNLSPSARLSRMKDKRSSEEIKTDANQRVRLRTIQTYTKELQSEFGDANVKVVINPDGSVSWWTRNSDGSGSLVKTY